MPGKKMNSIKGGAKGRRQYEGLKKHGFSKSSAAAITNANMKRRKRGKK
jgi:hypothetical protein